MGKWTGEGEGRKEVKDWKWLGGEEKEWRGNGKNRGCWKGGAGWKKSVGARRRRELQGVLEKYVRGEERRGGQGSEAENSEIMEWRLWRWGNGKAQMIKNNIYIVRGVRSR